MSARISLATVRDHHTDVRNDALVVDTLPRVRSNGVAVDGWLSGDVGVAGSF
jgi:hypothetical protein